MASYVFKDCFFSIGPTGAEVDLTAYVKSVTLNMGKESQDASAVAISTAAGLLNTRIFLPGLATWSMDVEGLQDFAVGKVDATIQAGIASGIPLFITFRPTAAAVGTSNPKYTGQVVVESYSAVSGNVGEVATFKLSLKPATVLTRATA